MSKTDWHLILVFVLLEMALLGIGVSLGDSDNKQKEALTAQQIIDTKQDRRIEELEKEIRLLKTDLYITQNGFEGGTE